MCIAFANTKLNFDVSGNGFIAVIHNSAKVWVSYGEYTISKKTIAGEIIALLNWRYQSCIPKQGKVLALG